MSSMPSQIHLHPRSWKPEAWAAAGIFPLCVLLGLAVSTRRGAIFVIVIVLATIATLGVRHRWGSVICLTPVFLFPVTVMTRLPSAGALHWRFILASVTATLVTIYWLQGARRPKLNQWSLAAVGFLFISLLVLGRRTGISLQDSASLPLFAYSGLIIGQCLRDSTAIRALAFLAVPIAGLAILEAVGLENVWGIVFHANAYTGSLAATGTTRSTTSFGHPLIAGACLTATGLLLLSLRERLLTISGVICIVAAVTTVSRSALLGGTLGILLFTLQARGHRMRTVAIAIALALSVFLAVESIPSLKRSFDSRIVGLNQTTLIKQESVRTNSFSIIKDEFNDNPNRLFIGGGVGYSVKLLTARGGNAAGYNIFDNEYITMMYDAGLFVVLVVLALLVRASASASRDSRRRALPTLAALVVVMYFVDGMNWPSLGLLTWIAIGFFTVPASRDRTQSRAGLVAEVDA